MLQDLALYFLIWTEGANVRHLPEAIWWLFWILSWDLARVPALAGRTTGPDEDKQVGKPLEDRLVTNAVMQAFNL